MDSMDRFRVKTIAELPPWTDDAAERLAHTIAAFDSLNPTDWAITATVGVYGNTVTTGLTWGDLRELCRRLNG